MNSDFGQLFVNFGQVVGQVSRLATLVIPAISDRSERFGQIFNCSTLHARHKRDGKNPSKSVHKCPNDRRGAE